MLNPKAAFILARVGNFACLIYFVHNITKYTVIYPHNISGNCLPLEAPECWNVSIKTNEPTAVCIKIYLQQKAKLMWFI